MRLNPFRRDRDERPHNVHSDAVSAARAPALYTGFRVPDTPEGRFEMAALHVGLVVRRLSAGEEEPREFARRVSEAFFAHLDQSLRDLGIGDLGVPRRMKKLAQGFYGRLTAYGDAIAAGNLAALADALRRNVFDGADDAPAEGLARYVAAAAAALEAAPLGDIESGLFRWPAAEPFLAVAG